MKDVDLSTVLELESIVDTVRGRHGDDVLRTFAELCTREADGRLSSVASLCRRPSMVGP